MAYLEDVIAATKKTKARTKNAESGASILAAMAAQKAALMQSAVAGATPSPTPRRPTSPAGPVANKKPHSMGDGHGHNSAAEVKGLNAEFNSALQRMMKDSGGRFSIGSGYRSMAEQKVLYDRYRRGDPRQKAPAAAPGKSNHNHGLAADLKYKDNDARAWVHANAGKYGLRFPMSYEPWHIEPVNAKAKRKT